MDGREVGQPASEPHGRASRHPMASMAGRRGGGPRHPTAAAGGPQNIYDVQQNSSRGMRGASASRRGLSPLLAIIIGLVVTVVAGILLAQLYFGYAASISARPAANIEYVDLVVGSDNTGILVMNIKNMGNVQIDIDTVDVQLDVNGDGTDDCDQTVQGNGNPGGTISATCTLSGVAAGTAYSGFVVINFGDGSSQSYAFTVRARAA